MRITKTGKLRNIILISKKNYVSQFSKLFGNVTLTTCYLCSATHVEHTVAVLYPLIDGEYRFSEPTFNLHIRTKIVNKTTTTTMTETKKTTTSGQ